MNRVSYLSLIIIISVIVIFPISEIAYAQVDIIIDCDGIVLGAMDGCSTSQEVTPGSPLTPFPTTIPPGLPGVPAAGIDWFDRDNSRTWTIGDDLHSEALDTCPTANSGAARNGIHDSGDCPILDLDGNLGTFFGHDPGGSLDLVDCDLETGGSPSGMGAMTPPFGFPPPPPPCQDIRPNVLITFFDTNGDTFWNDGEDIVLDVNGNLIFDPPMTVGGKFLDIDRTAVVLAGAKYTTSWLIPALVSAIGFGLLIARKI
jgi:hypothetical protein